MAKNKQTGENNFTDQLVNDLNKELGDQVAFLVEDGSPSDVKVFVSTGSKLLDYSITNREDGGWPVGKISELSGLEGTGKSLLAMTACAQAQKQGALVVYLDTENAIQTEFAERIGLDLKNNFIWMNPDSVEDVFSAIYKLIHSLDELEKKNKQSPYKFVFLVWDSIASTPAQKDLVEENPDPQATISLKARILSKNLASLAKSAGKKNIAFLFLNQLRTKLNVQPFQDPYVEPGGKAVPFYSSVRIRITNKGKVKVNDDVVGIQVKAKVVKTRFCGPYRECEFPIYFTHGIDNLESVITELTKKGAIKTKSGGPKGKLFWLPGENEESAMGAVEFKKKIKTDPSFNSKIMAILKQEMTVDMVNPEEVEIVVDPLNASDGEV